MPHAQSDVSLLVEEYATLVGEVALDWERVGSALASEADWTREGADTVVTLARQYGSFVLRNALALALATHVEDGSVAM
ncbi:MAG: hypothetical protein R6X20_03260 [Phycisphaerae bacterium]